MIVNKKSHRSKRGTRGGSADEEITRKVVNYQPENPYSEPRHRLDGRDFLFHDAHLYQNTP